MSKHHKKPQMKSYHFEELETENNSILTELKRLEKQVQSAEIRQKLLTIREKFKGFSKQCSVFNSNTRSSLNDSKIQAKKFLHSIESSSRIREKISKKKTRIQSQEIVIGSQEKQWKKSLGNINGLWQKNLNDMESSIRIQKETLKRIGTQYLHTMNYIEKEIQEVIEGPKVPNLHLEVIKKNRTPSKLSSARSSSSMKLSDEEEIISNRSAFSFITEDIVSHRSNSSRPRLPIKRLNPPLPPALPSPSINISYLSDENESVEFDKLMSELEKEKERHFKENPNSISMEKTLGGWKSEYESEGESLCLNLNPDEIKKALMVLKKAKLLNAGGNHFLMKLAEMIKDSENSSNVELMLQLINIERKKNKNSQKFSSRSRASGKPPTPTHSSQARKKKLPIELVDTSREKFMFSEDKSFHRTILSIENHLSPKGNDFLDEDFAGQEMNDVNIHDLLNVSSIIDNLGLISADTSLIQEENENSRVNIKINGEDFLKQPLIREKNPVRSIKRLPLIS